MAHHSKSIAFAALLLVGTAANAQGSEIAYATGGGRAEVHLINADSSGHSLLYTAPRGAEINHVDIRPGGGQLAIEEHVTTKGRTPTQISKIKVIDYDANGVMVGAVRTHQLMCLTGSLDYHPNGETLLYRSCDPTTPIMRLDIASMTATDLGLADNVFIASWIDEENVLYWGPNAFRTVSINDLANPTFVISHFSPGLLDVSTTGTQGLSSDGVRIYLLNTAAAPSITQLQLPGQRGHFSPGDDLVIYVSGSEVGQKNQNVLIRRTDGAGAVTTLTGQGRYRALDWRN
jgi:hypothetical protein